MLCIHDKKKDPMCINEWCTICVQWQNVQTIIKSTHCYYCFITCNFFDKLSINDYNKRIEIVIQKYNKNEQIIIRFADI
jgi:hypothetical protein